MTRRAWLVFAQSHLTAFYAAKKNSHRIHAEENKRRTLQRSDIATAISKTDMCDFLIDIVPREEVSVVQEACVDCLQSLQRSYFPILLSATTIATEQPWV